MPHTILSIRQSLSAGPCKIRKFANVNACLEDVCRMYELLLRHQQGNPASVTYEIEHLFQFIDKLTWVKCAVYQESTQDYQQQTKLWMKKQMHTMLYTYSGRSTD